MFEPRWVAVLGLGWLGCAPVPQDVPPPPTLDLMTFNIRYDSGLDVAGADAWSNLTAPRRDRVVTVIAEAAPAVFGVQEALAGQMAGLLTALPDYEGDGVGRTNGDTQGE